MHAQYLLIDIICAWDECSMYLGDLVICYLLSQSFHRSQTQPRPQTLVRSWSHLSCFHHVAWTKLLWIASLHKVSCPSRLCTKYTQNLHQVSFCGELSRFWWSWAWGHVLRVKDWSRMLEQVWGYDLQHVGRISSILFRRCMKLRAAWFQVVFPESHYLSQIVYGLAKMLQDATRQARMSRTEAEGKWPRRPRPSMSVVCTFCTYTLEASKPVVSP